MEKGIFSKINFRQPKYMYPAFLYLPIAFLGGTIVSWLCGDGVSHENKFQQQYLESGVPEANVDTTLGDKMDNADAVFGKNMDVSAIGGLSNDKDSVDKKMDYQSQYNDREAQIVADQKQEEAELAEQKKREQAENKKLREMQDRVRNSGNRRSAGRNTDDDGFVDPVSDNAIARAQRIRRQRELEQINNDLAANPYRNGNRSRRSSANGLSDENVESSESYNDGLASSSRYGGSSSGNSDEYRNGSNNNYGNVSRRTSSDKVEGNDEDPKKVVKKVRLTSDYFNTVGYDKHKKGMITAIIDENIKAVDGSRVRLRLLDDIQIEGVTVRKGTYLYAKMSGFGQQRVQGTVESIFYDDDIINVSLSIYDTDGLQGLYVPESQFRETAKDVGSQAMSGGNNILDNSYSNSGIRGWASQAAQNATQRVMSAVGKVIKKNRVKLKYGTKVYLVDGSSRQRSVNRQSREAAERRESQTPRYSSSQFNPYMNYGQYEDGE